ncbi:MAG: aldehyde dehydrogenase family protein, partial [Gaiellaceae bacterium]
MTELERKQDRAPVPSEWTYASAPEARDVVTLQDRYGHYVGGEWLEAKETYTTISPSDEEPLAEVGQATPEEVQAAVAAARNAFENGWSDISPAERAKYLFRIARILQERSREFAVLESLNGGKPIKESRDVDLPLSAAHFFYYAGWADKLEYAFPNRRPKPIGVAGQIIPWNFPLLMLAWKIAPALAAGNTVVLKPPEWAPLTCSMLGDLATEAGLPPGVLNVVHGSGAEAGAPLTGHPGVDRVAFTGSPATARTVYRDAAAQLTPVSFELGGKSPFVVLDDADLDAAAATAAYQYDNSGQVCLAGTRLLVQRAVLDEFLARFRTHVDAIRVGDPREPGTTYGPLIHPVALERVTGHVRRALEEGATLAFGGEPLEGLYYPPTLFTDVPAGAALLRQEVFGPVLALQPFDDDEEAIGLANATDFGLAATIYTGSPDRARRLSARISAGTVWVNCFY